MNASAYSGSGGNGLYMDCESDPANCTLSGVVSYNVISNSTIYANDSNPIAMYNAYNNNLTGNNITSGQASALSLYSSGGNLFANSTLQSGTIDINFDTYYAEGCGNTFENVTGTDGVPFIYVNSTSVSLSSPVASEIILCNASYSSISNFSGKALFVMFSNYTNVTGANMPASASPYAPYPLYLKYSTGPRVENSSFAGLYGQTINANYCPESRIYNVSSSSGNSYAIYLSDSPDSSISNSTFFSNLSNAVVLQSDRPNLTGSSITTNSSNPALVISNSNATILRNTILGAAWIGNWATGAVFNDSSSGNAYYFLNGTGAWKVYNISSTDGTTWANAGPSRPFNATTLGSYWQGNGGDFRPYTENVLPPNVVISYPASGANLTSRTTCFNITVSQSLLPVDACYVTVNGGAPDIIPGCGNGTLSNLPDGQVNITLYANDTAGNTNSTSIVVNVAVPQQQGGGSGLPSPTLSYSFNCSSGVLEVNATNYRAPISGLEVRLYETSQLGYARAATNGSGIALFSITHNANYAIENSPSSSYAVSRINRFPLALCAPVPQGGQNGTTPGTNVTAPPQNGTEPGQNATQNVTVTRQDAEDAIRAAEAAITDALKAGKDVSGAIWKISAAKDAFNINNYPEAKALADEAAGLANGSAPRQPQGNATSPLIPEEARPAVGIGSFVFIAGAVALVAIAIGGYLWFFRKK
ncbi:Right handed beta helix region [uncultured archaeon]|nr:Right handed beta helix region [uncultured archaeon]